MVTFPEQYHPPREGDCTTFAAIQLPACMILHAHRHVQCWSRLGASQLLHICRRCVAEEDIAHPMLLYVVETHLFLPKRLLELRNHEQLRFCSFLEPLAMFVPTTRVAVSACLWWCDGVEFFATCHLPLQRYYQQWRSKMMIMHKFPSSPMLPQVELW